jgi:hypothetical protein
VKKAELEERKTDSGAQNPNQRLNCLFNQSNNFSPIRPPLSSLSLTDGILRWPFGFGSKLYILKYIIQYIYIGINFVFIPPFISIKDRKREKETISGGVNVMAKY